MTDHAQAFTYGVMSACAVSLVLLIADSPSGGNLLLAIALGIVGVAGSYWWMVNR